MNKIPMSCLFYKSENKFVFSAQTNQAIEEEEYPLMTFENLSLNHFWANLQLRLSGMNTKSCQDQQKMMVKATF